jgi:hypothetical protein
MFVIEGALRRGGRGRFEYWNAEEARRERILEGQLIGDALVFDRVLRAVERAEELPATPTGPSYVARLDEPAGVFLAAAELFLPGEYDVTGDTGIRPSPALPPGAVN